MVDNWMRVGHTEAYPGVSEDRCRRHPRLVNPGAGQLPQLGHPAPDVRPVGIELRSLADRIEDAEIRGGVGTAPRGPLPAEDVVRKVCVDERIPEPAFA